MPSPAMPLSVENEVMLGAAGATVSTVTFITAEAALVMPDDRIGRGQTMAPRPARAAVIKLQAPLAFAVAVPSSVVPS